MFKDDLKYEHIRSIKNYSGLRRHEDYEEDF